MPCRCISQCSPSASFFNPPLFGVPRKCQSDEGKGGQSSSSLSSPSPSPPLAVDRKQLSSDAVCHSMCFKAEVVLADWLAVCSHVSFCCCCCQQSKKTQSVFYCLFPLFPSFTSSSPFVPCSQSSNRSLVAVLCPFVVNNEIKNRILNSLLQNRLNQR